MVNHPTVSFILPTVGRATLSRALASIEAWEGDEVLAVQLDPPGGDWGGKERNIGIQRAKGDYLAFLDDDCWYAPRHRRWMHNAAVKYPGLPALFQMQYPSGRVLWETPRLKNGNVGSPMFFIPNDKSKLPEWGHRRCADFLFLDGFGWPARKIVWLPQIIAFVGHEDGAHVAWLKKQEAVC